ncbi:MAG: acyl-CoA thioesterase [Methylomarinum sp.]|nr:acyl-CoA thioesterase [Methylomarinum sp.]
MTVLMTPDMANFSGNVHGGSLLKLLDQVAYACAAKYSKRYVVTVSLDQVSFKQKVKVGELVTFHANINYVGFSSMEVGIKVFAEDLRSQENRYTTSCYFTMVAVDDEGKAVKVPSLELKTELDKRLYQAGAVRKEMRKESMKRTEEMHVEIEKGML